MICETAKRPKAPPSRWRRPWPLRGLADRALTPLDRKILACRVSVVCSIPSKSAEIAQFGRWAVLYRNQGVWSVPHGGKTAEHLSFGEVLSPCAGRDRDACTDAGAGA